MDPLTPAHSRLRRAPLRLRGLSRLAAGLLALSWGIQAAEPVPPGPHHEGRLAFRAYGPDEGLTDSVAQSLLQDREGFLWTGTQDGLFRFDGRRFARYGRAEGLPSARVFALHEAVDGTLWVGTGEGVARRAPGEDRFEAVAGLPASGSIASDLASTVYVGSQRGLFAVRAGAVEPVRGVPAGTGRMSGLYVAPRGRYSGTLFFGRGGRLFARAPSGEIIDFGAAHALSSSEEIDAILLDAQGTLWVRSARHLWSLSEAAPAFVGRDAGVPPGFLGGALGLDGEGSVLVPTVQGLAQRRGAGFHVIGRAEGLEPDAALAALVDREGSLWIGTAGGGLLRRLGTGSLRSYGASEGVSHELVWGAARAFGALWVATETGLDRLDPATGRFQHWQPPHGLPKEIHVSALTAGPDGDLWAALWTGGVLHLGADGRAENLLARGRTAKDFRLFAIHVTPDGTVWAGGSGGAYRLDPRTRLFELLAVPGGDAADSVYSLTLAPDGALWAGARQGLLRLSPGAPLRLRVKDGLRADAVGSVLALPDGRLAIAYREALGFDFVDVATDGRLHLEPHSVRNGLASDKVVALAFDQSGLLWAGSGSGLDLLAPDGRVRRHLDRSDGLPTDDVDGNALFAERSGLVWIGTSKGLSRFDPVVDLHAPAARPPPTVLTGWVAGSEPVRASAVGRVALGAARRSVAFSWAGLSFVKPARTRFRYRLIGLEDAWQETDLSKARFAALHPGRYRFEVEAIGPTGLVSAAPATAEFEILPRWFETLWFKAALLLGFGASIVGAVRLRVRQLELNQQRLEQAVAERSAQLARANGELARTNKDLAAVNRELREASFTDPLTRLRNRRFFQLSVGEDVRRTLRMHAQRDKQRNRDLVLYVVDLDHFKQVNDGYGHDAGDRLLVQVAERLMATARDSDLVVRWGGEEFLVLSRDCARDEGSVLASRLLEVIGSAPFDLGNGRTLSRTCSVGWAPFPLEDGLLEGPSVEESIRLADQALYAAKSQGRNRAVGALPAASGDTERSGLGSTPELIAAGAELAELTESGAVDLRTVEGPEGSGEGKVQ